MDQKEFIGIIKEHQGIINNVCHLYFSEPEDRKDARQEVILQLWKSYPNFNYESKWSTWIYSVSLNTMLNLIRKTKSRAKRLEIVALRAEFNYQVCFNDDIEYLKYLINCLKEIDKAVILLYLEGYSNTEISNILSLTMTNVSSRIHRIKRHLKKLHTTKFYEIR